jgi:hypothetical protein
VGGGGSATFSAKRAFGGIYSRSAEDDAEAKFVVDSFATYASTNALYPVCNAATCVVFPADSDFTMNQPHAFTHVAIIIIIII